MSPERENDDQRQESEESAYPNDAEAWSAQEDLRRLRELCRNHGPAEPDESAWQATQLRIQRAVRFASSGTGRSRRPVWAILGTISAAVIAFVLLSRAHVKDVPRIDPPLVEEPFAVVDPEDVVIVSMDARDVGSLVVGLPPISGDVEFARPEDIHVIKCECCPFCGRKARLVKRGEVPMFVSTAAAGEPDEDE